ncbi:hypothetical protein PV327_000981 [Microctonus hyperodae]|uniref:Uncharacterized protein n=1 Tax=Microctonus hyperodae TaxID=165561 RepID=A0AA39G7A5_MICHY|nr:hypothetical protein PV327_000981 [Microctonus hyperodae]
MGAQDEATSETGGASDNTNKSDNPPSKDNIFENRSNTKKIIRVVTVMAYLFSVSFVAIALSGYYVFLWQPPNPRLIPRARIMSQEQIQDYIDISSIDLLSSTTENNKINITEIFSEMNNKQNEIIRNRNINTSTDKLFHINNKGNSSSTNLMINPIIAQMHGNQSQSDKVTTDTWTDVYNILSDGIDDSVRVKNLGTPTLFTKLLNASETFTTNDLSSQTTEGVIAKEEINSTEDWNFSYEQQLIPQDQIPSDDEQIIYDTHDLVTSNSSMDSILISSTQSIKSINDTRGDLYC